MWFFILAIIGVVVAVDWIGCGAGIPREERLPYAGWALEVFGVLIVFYGIADKLALFGAEGLVKHAVSLLREFPLFRSKQQILSGIANLNLQTHRAQIRVISNPPPNATLEERVEFLLGRVAELYELILDVQEDSGSKLNTLKKEIDEKLESVRREIENARSQSEQAHVGQLGWEYAGLGWIMLGLTLATVPDLVMLIFAPVIPFLEWIPC